MKIFQTKAKYLFEDNYGKTHWQITEEFYNTLMKYTGDISTTVYEKQHDLYGTQYTMKAKEANKTGKLTPVKGEKRKSYDIVVMAIVWTFNGKRGYKLEIIPHKEVEEVTSNDDEVDEDELNAFIDNNL